MDNFSDRLTHKMHKKGYTQESLAEILNCSHSTISRWIGGSKPRRGAAINLASALQVNVEWLLNNKGEETPETLERTKAALKQKAQLGKLESNVMSLTESLTEIPVLSWAHAGEAMAYEQMPEGYLEPMAVPSSLINGYKAFGLIVDGDSMEPVIEHGDQIAVMQDCQPRNGCFVVAKFIHDSGVMVRRYQVLSAPNGKPEKVKLIPYNSFYDATEHHISEFEWIMPVAAMARKLW